MRTKTMLASAAVAVLTLGLSAAPASAGEVTGSGKPTPIAGYNANSICSFSGLEDGEGGVGGPGVTPQNWGQSLRAFVEAEGITVGEGVALYGAPGIPGTECNGSGKR